MYVNLSIQRSEERQRNCLGWSELAESVKSSSQVINIVLRVERGQPLLICTWKHLVILAAGQGDCLKRNKLDQGDVCEIRMSLCFIIALHLCDNAKWGVEKIPLWEEMSNCSICAEIFVTKRAVPKWRTSSLVAYKCYRVALIQRCTFYRSIAVCNTSVVFYGADDSAIARYLVLRCGGA